MSQTSYNRDPGAGYAGYSFDTGPKNISSAPAAETIPFGVLVELQVNGTIRVYRGTGKIFGVSMGKDVRETGQFAIGGTAAWKLYEQVPVMRSGRMFVQFESNAALAALTAPNVWTPSDNSLTNLAKLGLFTSRATSATTGAEITAVAAGILSWKLVAATATVAVVELTFN